MRQFRKRFAASALSAMLLALASAGGCGSDDDENGTGGSGGSGGDDASAGSGGTGGVSEDDAQVESDAPSDAEVTCNIGEATSEATASDLSLFGTPVYFNDGDSIPPGTYRISYVDGCMKYGGGQGWTVNAYDQGGCCHWWLIGANTSDTILVPPGTIGFAAGSGAFADFQECVTASRAAPAKDFEHAGGKLGIWLQDSPYTDNSAGEGGNPKWKLERLGACVDGGGLPEASTD